MAMHNNTKGSLNCAVTTRDRGNKTTNWSRSKFSHGIQVLQHASSSRAAPPSATAQTKMHPRCGCAYARASAIDGQWPPVRGRAYDTHSMEACIHIANESQQNPAPDAGTEVTNNKNDSKFCVSLTDAHAHTQQKHPTCTAQVHHTFRGCIHGRTRRSEIAVAAHKNDNAAKRADRGDGAIHAQTPTPPK